MEIGVTKTTATTLPSTSAGCGAAGGGAIIAAVERSSPLNMPLGAAGVGIGGASVAATARAGVPVLIESGSYSK